MVGIIKRSTANFNLGIPFFDAPGWGAAFERDMDIIDAVLSTAGTVTNIIGAWANSTVYGSDDRVVDVTDNSVWQAAVSHTSASTGTFAADRIAHPTYWDAVSTSVVVREEFVTGTDYFVGDFVYDTAEHLGGIVKTAFTGGATLRTNIANLGIIFDLKSDLTAIPTIQANVLALQNGSQLHSLSASAITDLDEIGFWEDVAGLLRKITWANIKSTLKTYFDTIYQPATSILTNISALTGVNGSFIRFTGLLTVAMQAMVGTVTQSAGVPTGAIIEKGSNGNGIYTKYADGTLICSFFDTTARTINAAAGSVFSSSSLSYTFPSAFVVGSVPALVITANRDVTGGAGDPWGGRVASVGATGFTCTLMAAANTAVAGISYIAHGRWF